MSAVINPQTPGDSLTVLTSAGPRLTKVWDSATGKPQAYEKVQQVSVQERFVSDIYGVSALLTELEGERNTCIIRGKFIGHTKAKELYPAEIENELRVKKKVLQTPRDGFTLRRLTFFKPQALHFFYIDIDSYKPEGLDPVLEPEACINQYIARHLPVCFQGITFHWQLSSGAGHPDNPGVLKAHVAFWLSAPQLGDDLDAWVKSEGLLIDVSVFRTVQPNYTAAPVFVNGVQDPVPVRSGLCEGFLGDAVDLVIPAIIVLRARSERKARAEMVDPRDKETVHGLFCRTYEIEDVVANWLSDQFEFVTEWRLNWLGGGGSGEGAGVTENRQGIFNTHNTDPFRGRAANKWDLVRYYKFGHLDAGLDEFELMDMRDRPSEQAMREFVRTLPEMKDTGAEERAAQATSFVDQMLLEIEAATLPRTLEHDIAPRIAGEFSLADSDRAVLAGRIGAKLRALGATMPIAQVRNWLRARPATALGATFPDTNADGNPLGTVDNLEVLLDQLDIVVRYNVIGKQTEILIPGASATRDNRDNVTVTRIISECERIQMSTRYTQQYLLNLSDSNPYNPVMTWIESEPWDGVERVQDLIDTIEHDPAEISEELKVMLVRKWLTQAVAAASSEDGIANQGVLTFTGAQNKGKTTWLKNLAPRHLDVTLSGHTLDVKSKDSLLVALRHWIVELGEIDATFRKSDVSNLKSWINNSVDNIRRPYAVSESSYGRRTVFGASVNDEQFLADKTGNRRFWTIPILGFKFDHGIDMQQVWAEVWANFQKGGEHARFNLNEQELALLNVHNAGFEVTDPIEERIAAYWDWSTDPATWTWITVTECLMQTGIREPKKQDTIAGGAALKKLSGGRRRKSHGRVLHAIPAIQVAANDFLA
jgi:putative DNA primase/helicase